MYLLEQKKKEEKIKNKNNTKQTRDKINFDGKNIVISKWI